MDVKNENKIEEKRANFSYRNTLMISSQFRVLVNIHLSLLSTQKIELYLQLCQVNMHNVLIVCEERAISLRKKKRVDLKMGGELQNWSNFIAISCCSRPKMHFSHCLIRFLLSFAINYGTCINVFNVALSILNGANINQREFGKHTKTFPYWRSTLPLQWMKQLKTHCEVN